MSNISRTAIILLLILIVTIILSITAVSLINNNTTKITKKDVDKIVDETLQEITTYIQVKDKIGKYYMINGTNKIKEIAILIKPLVTTDIDFSEFSIKISNGENIKFFNYNKDVDTIGSSYLFEHSIWSEIENNEFGILIVTDRDNSILNYDIMNDDNAYILIKLPEQLTLEKNDSLTVTLLPLSGIQKTISLKAPLPMKSIITFD